MSNDIRFLNMREAGRYLGQSYRWMQRNYVYLVRSGVIACRVPKDAPKGRLVFEKESMNRYIDQCRIKADFNVLQDKESCGFVKS